MRASLNFNIYSKNPRIAYKRMKIKLKMSTKSTPLRDSETTCSLKRA